MQFERTCSEAQSTAIERMSPITPALLAQYAASSAVATRADIDEMNTSEHASARRLTACFAQRNEPVRLTAITLLQSTRLVSANSLSSATPADVTSAATGPSSAATRSKPSATLASSETSQTSARSAGTSCTDSERSSAATRPPSSRKSSVVARPIPDAAPLTTQTLPPSLTGHRSASAFGGEQRADRLEVGVVELEFRGGAVLLDVRGRGATRDRGHDRRAAEEPGEGQLGGGRAPRLGEAGEVFVACEPAGGDRRPGDEGDPPLRAQVDEGIVLPAHEAVRELDADQLDGLAGLGGLLDGHVREPDVTDEPLLLELAQRPELLVQRNLQVEPVDLEDVELLDAQMPEAEVNLLADVLAATDGHPVCRARPGLSGLRRDHEVVGIGMEGLLQQLFAPEGPVRVGCVDEVDAEVDGAA